MFRVKQLRTRHYTSHYSIHVCTGYNNHGIISPSPMTGYRHGPIENASFCRSPQKQSKPRHAHRACTPTDRQPPPTQPDLCVITEWSTNQSPTPCTSMRGRHINDLFRNESQDRLLPPALHHLRLRERWVLALRREQGCARPSALVIQRRTPPFRDLQQLTRVRGRPGATTRHHRLP